MKLSLPNQLTVARIVFIPIFLLVFYIPLWGANNYILAGIFFIASVTDWLDGYLARRWDQQSDFGAFLDPVADKLMIATVLVCLVSKYPSFGVTISAVIIVGREITVSALREWMASLGERAKVKVGYPGKIKTGFQMLAIGLMLYEVPVWGINTLETGKIFLYIAAALTVWSMLGYLKAAWPSLYESQENQ
ncbi:CDP-diacylglycerol--glycerol-3-phosphate 3-phosphatidyltransferase [hydrothermal vent metagenome]|uniref:CDP-diacylglycerol--glycerol-3-phosphate 3-phosphatidyltransferase n=1 Tax=hydrothermal vent metagenome TaxID=652676 RepID=A0A3B1ADN7_9ZZZZ